MGFGFVTFKDDKSTKNSIEGMNGHKLDEGGGGKHERVYSGGSGYLSGGRYRSGGCGGGRHTAVEAVVVVEEAVVDTEVEDVRVDTVLLERGRGGGWGYEGGEGGGYEGSLGVGVW
ncbi:unnamed protein product [Brassica oleracea]